MLILATLLSICFSLWIRRAAWNTTYQRAATINLVLQGAAIVLMSPWASAHIGYWLHAVTGWNNLEDYLGHDCYIAAASAIAFNALGRLDDGNRLVRSFKLYVELPATVAVPLMLVAFALSSSTDEYADDFFQIPADFWLSVYWFIVCATLIHLLGYTCRMLAILRDDPRSTRIANAYLASSACGIAACLTRMLMSIATWIPPAIGSGMIWTLACACGIGFAATGAWSWLGNSGQEVETPAIDDHTPRRPEPV